MRMIYDNAAKPNRTGEPGASATGVLHAPVADALSYPTFSISWLQLQLDLQQGL